MPNNNEIIENENSLTYQNQRFYSPRFKLDRSLYKPGQLIPVMDFVNPNLYKQGNEIASHNSLANSYINMNNNLAHPNINQPPIDLWIAQDPKDRIFSHIRGAIIAPIHRLYGMQDNDPANTMLDYFYVTAKRCYNSDTKMKDGKLSIGFRDHCTNYMNYFEKFWRVILWSVKLRLSEIIF